MKEVNFLVAKISLIPIEVGGNRNIPEEFPPQVMSIKCLIIFFPKTIKALNFDLTINFYLDLKNIFLILRSKVGIFVMILLFCYNWYNF